jgi:hypothetical protein
MLGDPWAFGFQFGQGKMTAHGGVLYTAQSAQFFSCTPTAKTRTRLAGTGFDGYGYGYG